MQVNEQNAQPEVQKEIDKIEEEIEVELTSRADYITSAYFAISSVEGLDTQIMSKEDAKRVKRILRKSLMIIDDCITEMFDELYENDTED